MFLYVEKDARFNTASEERTLSSLSSLSSALSKYKAVALSSVSDLVPFKSVQECPRCSKVLEGVWTLLLVLALVVVPSNLSGMPGTSRGP